jgi:hypothetical protein
MRVGMAAVFQNPGRTRRDFDIYRFDIYRKDVMPALQQLEQGASR